MFEKLGGPEIGAMARRRFFEGHIDKASLDAWLRLAFPLYTCTPRDMAAALCCKADQIALTLGQRKSAQSDAVLVQ